MCEIVTGEDNIRTGILGGSFDPIHNGHLSIVDAALEELALDKVLLIPTKVSPFKIGRKVAPDEDRLEMTRLALKDRPGCEVSDIEIRKQGVSYTIFTLDELSASGLYGKLYFLMGTDTFLELESWYKGTELLEKYAFALAPRPGFARSEFEEKLDYYRETYGTDVTVLNNEMLPISSTKIRARLAEGLPVTGLLPDDVESYILENGLYGEY